MLIKTFLRVVVVVAALAVAGNVQAVVRGTVVGSAERDYKNPKLYIKGIGGDAEIAKIATNDLKLCGWFDITNNSAEADYTISGAASAGSLQLTVTGAKSFNVTQPLAASDRDHCIHKGVDMVLNKLFGIAGICSSRIAFSVKAGRAKNIYIADFDARNIKQITKHTNLCVEAEWTPDAKSLIYTMYGTSNTDIVQTIINPLSSRLLVRMPGLNCGASVSPNGQLMAMISSRDKQVELYVKPVFGSSMTRLTNDSAVEASPCWFKDSSKICFVSDKIGRRPRLFVISASGGHAEMQPTIGSEAVSPHVSSNGSIVYSCKMGSNYSMAIISKDEKVKSGIIINQAGDWESPSWAPDNRHIICAKNNGGLSSLYIVDTWTMKVRPYMSGYDMTYPSWSNIY